MSDQIELVHLRQELEILVACADRKQRDIDATLAAYGEGVRPSWVSADIAIDGKLRDDYEAQARTVRRKIEALEKKLTGAS